tara:strand:- start:579 stop:1286 length:708 start_codon:yes stop_codon:yes gene_type:complete
MKKLALLALLLTVSYTALAEGIWINYAFKTNWSNRAAVADLFKNYYKTDFGKSFQGLMFLDSVVVNGQDPSTHSAAFVYKSEKDFENRRTAAAINGDFHDFVSQLTEKVEFIEETMLSHVAGFGLPAEQSKQWIAVAVEVRDAKKYQALMDEISGSEIAKLASFDLWAVVAGGTPGVTHYITIGVESRADFRNHETVQKLFAEVDKKASGIRTLKGMSYSDTVLTRGPLKSVEIR